ncbi:HipA domain-containing protein [Azospirillum sp.]|uniref:type II toxin-antitoxin system HipA family toxin n=1 Tax=Azospirillum sp. TaxID=34012 RepID=UPI002D370037|nr:HipA domain-containing protein [Azospirillum sp.]HYD67480.1 HipA domain-containing protein [Azospirillum sp.]
MTWRISDGRIDRLVLFKAVGPGYVPIGELAFEGGARVRQGRFAYAASWLEHPARMPIDPVGLPLRRKSFPAQPHQVPLAFYDAGPDGWGKSVLDAAFPTLTLGMAEYLALGTPQRTGDLAFGPTPDGGPQTWVPPHWPLLTLPSENDDLAALQAAAEAIEAGQRTDSHLQLLVRSGADVGGARPKARLRHDGGEWIAKFHAWGDAFDDPRMEAVCLDLAEAAGVPVAERRLEMVSGRTVLLVRRFDRSPDGEKHGYLSAGTLLGEANADYNSRKTYVDIAVVARRIGVPSPEPAVYRRLLVNAFLHNTDDHLRNHAFLRKGAAWDLAPGYDLVPNRVARHAIAPAPKLSPEWNPLAAMGSHRLFGLGEAEAQAIFDQVVEGCRRVRDVMDERAVTPRDREIVAPLLQACLSPPAWADRILT